ncbi:MAG: cytochrome C assembly protein [Chloroflexi bacterium]|nr:cytochrome C assembly protein [Chloroflexota bacterium]
MEAKPRKLRVLDGVSIVLLIIATGMVFFYAPMEREMGNVQRVFYFHVAAGWVGMIGFLSAVVAGIAYLRTGNRKWDIIGMAGIEVGLVFFLINIVSGSIWAKPTWNTWWRWDPRLVTATIMELIYFAYLMLRQGIEDPDRRARFGAIYAILGSVSVPFTFLSIRIWRTIHPVVIGTNSPDAEGSFNMETKMLQTLIFGVITFSFIASSLIWHRVRLGKLQDKIEGLRMKVMS